MSSDASNLCVNMLRKQYRKWSLGLSRLFYTDSIRSFSPALPFSVYFFLFFLSTWFVLSFLSRFVFLQPNSSFTSWFSFLCGLHLFLIVSSIPFSLNPSTYSFTRSFDILLFFSSKDAKIRQHNQATFRPFVLQVAEKMLLVKGLLHNETFLWYLPHSPLRDTFHNALNRVPWSFSWNFLWIGFTRR